MRLQVIISNQTNPYLNVAVENFLVSQLSPDTITLYLWKNHRTVVIGQNQNPFTECNVELLTADGGFLMRRRTGGGAVYHDGGNLNFSFIVPASFYDQQRQFGVLMSAVASYGLHCEVSGRNDVLCEGRKFSGNAFSRGKYNNLHHGTILIDGNVEDMRRYLKVKSSKLSRHGVASVQSRVVNLAELAPVTAQNIVAPLVSAFEKEYHAAAVVTLFDGIATLPEVKALADDFASDEWLYARWRSFEGRRRGSFSWGEVEVDYTIDESSRSFSNIQISTDSLLVDLSDQISRLLEGASTLEPPSLPTTADDDMQQSMSDVIALLYDSRCS